MSFLPAKAGKTVPFWEYPKKTYHLNDLFECLASDWPIVQHSTFQYPSRR